MVNIKSNMHIIKKVVNKENMHTIEKQMDQVFDDKK